jgi:hypothetical protein
VYGYGSYASHWVQRGLNLLHLQRSVFFRGDHGGAGGMGNRRLPAHLDRPTTGKLTLAHGSRTGPDDSIELRHQPAFVRAQCVNIGSLTVCIAARNMLICTVGPL